MIVTKIKRQEDSGFVEGKSWEGKMRRCILSSSKPITISVSCFLLLFPLISTVRSLNLLGDRRPVALRTTPGDNLQITQGSPFKIALFADLHFGEDAWTDWGPKQDFNSVKVMSSVLDNEHPANNIPIENASLYWDQAISPTRARNIPWASVFGNHDHAPFEWPTEWFSATGIPSLHCSVDNFSYTMRGMLYYKEALELQCFLDFAGDDAIFGGYQTIDMKEDHRNLKERAQALADLKFTYVVSYQVYGAQKKSSDARDQSCYANILNLMLT